MTIMQMLGQSGVLSLLGMSVVFGFLIIMIISITVVGKIIHALGLDKDAAPAKAAVAPPASGNGVSRNEASVTAAISAAVNEYRKSN
jgi:oxaloacetate decarboxylase gamma subunit